MWASTVKLPVIVHFIGRVLFKSSKTLYMYEQAWKKQPLKLIDMWKEINRLAERYRSKQNKDVGNRLVGKNSIKYWKRYKGHEFWALTLKLEGLSIRGSWVRGEFQRGNGEMWGSWCCWNGDSEKGRRRAEDQWGTEGTWWWRALWVSTRILNREQGANADIEDWVGYGHRDGCEWGVVPQNLR